MNKLLQLWEGFESFSLRYKRRIDSNKELKLKRGNIPFGRKLTTEERMKVQRIWGNIHPNTDYLTLYNAYNETFDARYMPDDIYYEKIDGYFNDVLGVRALDDKNLYDLLFPEINQPLTVVRKVGINFLDERYTIISKDKALGKIAEAQSVIFKKSRLSDGGQGIFFWKREDGLEKLNEIIKKDMDFVCQALIKQHPNISKVHPQSVNSIRMLTLNWHGEVRVLSSIIRMGANGNNVDNGHSGGIFTGIDDNGRLKDVAYTYMTGVRFEHSHPTTGAIFSESVIPNFDRCKQLVKDLAPRISSVSNLTSWDLSVNEDGEPVLIEANLAYGGLFFHQIANGPVFGDMTKEIIDEVFAKKK